LGTANYFIGGPHYESYPRHVIKYSLTTGAMMGTYNGLKCGLIRTRRTYDWKNALVAGGATGALFSLPMYVRGYANAAFVGKNALMVGGIAAALDAFRFM